MNDWLSKWPVTDYVSAMRHLAHRSKRVRWDAPIGNALRLVHEHVGPDTVSVVYHQTPVVTYYANGTQELNWGGWYTRTTFEHIERFTRLDDFRLRAHNRQRNGHGDGVELWRDSATWPRTPSRVTRCRSCKGTGQRSHDHECWNCRGAGSRERGKQAIPEFYDGDFRLMLHVDGTYEVAYDQEARPYGCKCSLCKCGCGNWQSHWQCMQADKWAAKTSALGYTPLWASPPIGVDLSAHTTPIPQQSAHVMHSEVLNSLAAVLPNLDHEVMCPKCRTTDPLRSVVVHLNDDHRVPREEIADWLDTLDVDLKFPTPA